MHIKLFSGIEAENSLTKFTGNENKHNTEDMLLSIEFYIIFGMIIACSLFMIGL